jgi:hypothetical protein
MTRWLPPLPRTFPVAAGAAPQTGKHLPVGQQLARHLSPSPQSACLVQSVKSEHKLAVVNTAQTHLGRCVPADGRQKHAPPALGLQSRPEEQAGWQ